MKNITFSLSADGKTIGSFTLDPLTEIRLLACARVNKKLTLTEYVRETLRETTLCDDYPDGPLYWADGEQAAVISAELAAAAA
jgi:hypothetical protein